MVPPGRYRRTPHVLRPGDVRHAYIDGDSLAYLMAGSDSCPKAVSREMMIARVRHIERITHAPATVLVTGRGSEKGKRFFIATVKPYQGHRAGSHKPNNWEFLRNILEGDNPPFQVIRTYEAEADDLFGQFAHEAGGNVAIHYDDKDMRMIPAVHLTWEHMDIVDMRDGEDALVWGKQYGLRWFWLQMLQGDSADNIPGLPWVVTGAKRARCGEKTAEQLLAGVDPQNYGGVVLHFYRALYGADAELHFLEQAMLLWMRKQPANPFCVVDNGPLRGLITADERAAMEDRLCA